MLCQILDRAGVILCEGSDWRYPRLRLAPGQLSAEMVGEGRKPNSVIILSDDLGYGDTTCYGGMNVNTPHIDELAKRDNLIPDRYSQCVWASRLF
jgi:hypothetical protein